MFSAPEALPPQEVFAEELPSSAKPREPGHTPRRVMPHISVPQAFTILPYELQEISFFMEHE